MLNYCSPQIWTNWINDALTLMHLFATYWDMGRYNDEKHELQSKNELISELGGDGAISKAFSL